MDLGIQPGYIFSFATAINNRGQVVLYNGSWEGTRAYLWYKGTLTDLGTLSGTDDVMPIDINDRGQVLGWSGGVSFLWQEGEFLDLSTQGINGTAYSINDQGQVAGFSGNTAVLWVKSNK